MSVFTGEFIAWSMTFAMFFLMILVAIYYFGGKSAHGYIAFILVLVLIPAYSIWKEATPPPEPKEDPVEDEDKDPP
jgi:hypothetical protein